MLDLSIFAIRDFRCEGIRPSTNNLCSLALRPLEVL